MSVSTQATSKSNVNFVKLLPFGMLTLASACGSYSKMSDVKKFAPSSVSDVSFRQGDQKNIVGGKIHDQSPAPSQIAKATVAITLVSYLAEKASFCSGTLIRKNVVLTAAHCFTEETRSGAGKDSGHDDVVIQFGGHVPERGIIVRAANHVRHETYNHRLTVSDERNYTPSDDIALVFLATNAPEGFEPIAVAQKAQGRSGAETPKEFTLAGFGITGEYEKDANGTPLKDPFGNLMVKENTGILRYVGVKLDYNYKPGKVFSVKSVGEVVEGSCQGDSGGPAYAKNALGEFEVYGALSTGDTTPVDVNADGKPDLGCNGRTIYTDAREYNSWIEEKIAQFVR